MSIIEKVVESNENVAYANNNNALKSSNNVNGDKSDYQIVATEHPCTICSKIFKKQSHLNRHMISHTKEKRFKCSYCDKSYLRNDHLHRHLTTHGLFSKPYICSFEGCNLTFYDSTKFRRHYTIHNRLSSLTNILGYKIDFSKIEGQSMINCPIIGCKMIAKTVHGMKRHLLSHTLKTNVDMNNKSIAEESKGDIKKVGMVKKVYFCWFEGCNQSYTRKSNVKAHYNVCHNNLKFTCLKCNSTFKWKRSLNKHKCK